MKKYIITLLALCMGLAHAEDKQYNGHGISLTYDSALSVDAGVKGVPTIIFKDDKGIQFMIQDYADKIEPGLLNTVMVKQLKGIFKESMQELSNKSVNRTLFGEKREGTYLVITKNGVAIEAVVFTFKHADKSWCIITQYAVKDTLKAEKMFAKIQSTLKTN